MKQELLADFELDVQQMKYLMDSISKEDNPALRALLKRNILQMKERLELMLVEMESISENASTSCEIQASAKLIPEVTSSEDQTTAELESKAFIAETAATDTVTINVLGESIWTSTDFRRSISLNDSFRFAREIFGGDSEKMNRVIEQVSAMTTLNAALAFLTSKVKIDEENEAMNDFLELLRKHFKSA